MEEKCIFNCSKTGHLLSAGAKRIHIIIASSKICGDHLYIDLDLQNRLQQFPDMTITSHVFLPTRQRLTCLALQKGPIQQMYKLRIGHLHVAKGQKSSTSSNISLYVVNSAFLLTRKIQFSGGLSISVAQLTGLV